MSILFFAGQKPNYFYSLYFFFCIIHSIMIINCDNIKSGCKRNMTSHAKERQKERNININGNITIDDVKNR